MFNLKGNINHKRGGNNMPKPTQEEVDKHWLKTIRQEREELMERINSLDRLEANVIKMTEEVFYGNAIY